MAGLPTRRPDGKSLLREAYTLAGPKSAGVLLGEAVASAGLDPAVFCAVIPADCGVLGVVNANNRIYDIAEGLAQHGALSESATAGGVLVGERGHPDTSESWDMLTRFMGGTSEVLESGAVRLSGRFALLNNSLGRDVLVAWQAGIPIGVSARGYGVVTEHTLDEKSPYAAMNPGRKGAKVKRVSEYELEAYDWVRVPSAGTHIDAAPTVLWPTAPGGTAEAANPEVKRALRRLREAQQQENTMFKTIEEFKSAHPEAGDDLLALMLTEARKQIVEEVKGVAGKPESAAAAAPEVRELVEQQAADRARVQALESERAVLTGKIDEVKVLATEAADRAKVWEGKAIKAELRGAVLTECDSLAKGNPAGALIKAKVMARFDAGKVVSVDEAKAEWADLVELTTGVTAAGKAPEPTVTGTPAKVEEGAAGGLAGGGKSGMKSLHDRIAEI